MSCLSFLTISVRRFGVFVLPSVQKKKEKKEIFSLCPSLIQSAWLLCFARALPIDRSTCRRHGQVVGLLGARRAERMPAARPLAIRSWANAVACRAAAVRKRPRVASSRHRESRKPPPPPPPKKTDNPLPPRVEKEQKGGNQETHPPSPGTPPARGPDSSRNLATGVDVEVAPTHGGRLRHALRADSLSALDPAGVQAHLTLWRLRSALVSESGLLGPYVPPPSTRLRLGQYRADCSTQKKGAGCPPRRWILRTCLGRVAAFPATIGHVIFSTRALR